MVIQKRYIKLKLMKPTSKKQALLTETLIEYKGCINMWLEQLKEFNGEYPTIGRLHQNGYYIVRAKYPKLHSNVTQEAMNRALGIYRTWRKNLIKDKRYPIYTKDVMSFKSVNVKIESNFISMPFINKKRIWLPIKIPSKFKKYLKLDRGNVMLKQVKEKWFCYIAIKEEFEEPYKPKGYIGLDLGVNNIAVLSNNIFYSGKYIKKYRENIFKTKRKLQSEKSRLNNKSRKLSKLRLKESRFTDNINHKISKEIVNIAKKEHKGLSIENLTGLRKNKKRKSNKMNRMLHNWKYRDLINKIVYKAQMNCVPIVFIDPRNTSKLCSKCGHKNNIKFERWFKCTECNLQLDRDLNASRNISVRASIP